MFFYRISPNRGKKGKNRPWEPRLTSSAKIGHVGVYFAKTGCKIEAGFADIFEFQLWALRLVKEVFCSALIAPEHT